MERTRLLSRASELPPKGRVHIKEGDREEASSHLCRKSRLWEGQRSRPQGHSCTGFVDLVAFRASMARLVLVLQDTL